MPASTLPYRPSPIRRLATFLVKVMGPVTVWFMRTEGRLERYGEGR